MNELDFRRYDKARTLIAQIAEAGRIDEVKLIADKGAAMKHFARQAHDPELECWVAEI